MIYGRFGNQVVIQRLAVLGDVKRLEGRKPDKQDREALENDSYVIVTEVDTGTERLYHQAFLRADSGSVEIGAVIDACKANGGRAP